MANDRFAHELLRMLTLWDLIPAALKRKAKERPASSDNAATKTADAPPVVAGAPARRVSSARRAQRSAAREPAQDRYDRVVQALLSAHQIRVRKWRRSMSGIAWYVTYRDGSVSRLIEAPRPKGPMSMAIFLHEVGHHAIGFDRYKPRCLEEYHAWAWAINEMNAQGLSVTDAVRYRMHASLWYAVDKARRRGLKELPTELLPFQTRPERRARRRRTAPR